LRFLLMLLRLSGNGDQLGSPPGAGDGPHQNRKELDMDGMNCPVCRAPADDISITDDKTSVICTACGEYDISNSILTAEQWLSLDPSDRRDLLENAKCSAESGTRPVIATHGLPAQPLAD
jgi:hypothetical protein